MSIVGRARVDVRSSGGKAISGSPDRVVGNEVDEPRTMARADTPSPLRYARQELHGVILATRERTRFGLHKVVEVSRNSAGFRFPCAFVCQPSTNFRNAATMAGDSRSNSGFKFRRVIRARSFLLHFAVHAGHGFEHGCPSASFCSTARRSSSRRPALMAARSSTGLMPNCGRAATRNRLAASFGRDAVAQAGTTSRTSGYLERQTFNGEWIPRSAESRTNWLRWLC